jgi:homoserine O-acetyltransferase/O-succinyltransferase
MSFVAVEAAAAPAEPDCPHAPLASARLDAALPRGGSLSLDFELKLEHAGSRRVRLNLEWVGDTRLPALWLAGGISAHRHAVASRHDTRPGWWQELADGGNCLDLQRHCLLAADWLGAEGEIDAPISTSDQARAIAYALDQLGIVQLDAFIGASYGGMVGQAFALLFPQRLRQLLCLSAGPRPHPFAAAYRALQRQVVALGQLQCADELGLSIARQLAMLSYRSPSEFAERFEAPARLDGGRVRVEAEGYLSRCGQAYAQRWSATAFLRLSESIDLHAIDPAQIRVPTTLLAVEGDWLAPPQEIEAFAAAIAAPVNYHCLRSRFGHDAFLKEPAAINALIGSALNLIEAHEGVH